ncbi:MAG: ATP-binding protein [Actinomycetota bacterium]
MTFRRRVAVGSAVAVAVTVVMASAVVYLVVRGELRGQVDDALRQRLDQILSPSSVSLVAGPDGIQVVIPPPDVAGESPGYVQFVASDGAVLRPGDETGQFMEPTRLSLAVAAGEHQEYFADVSLDGAHYRVVTARMPGVVQVPVRAEPIPQPMAVQVARPLTDVDAAMSRLAILLVAICSVGVGLGAALGFLITRTAARPVGRLTETAEHVTATGDLAARIEVGTNDEVGRLAASFNRMLEALERSVRAQRQLVADASHELRTPLTSLRTNIEVLARASELSPVDRDRLREDVVAQLDEMTALVADLVDLARDGQEPAARPTEVRLDLLVEAAVERAGRRAPGLRFSAELEPTVVVGSPERLDRAVGNLLDNAAKWSPPDGAVEVALRTGALTVRDHGPGIGDEDLPYVFDRFYRSVAARRLPGSGLGLAIVRQVAEAHGGTVEATNAPGGGALLRLRLPVLELPSTDPAPDWTTTPPAPVSPAS